MENKNRNEYENFITAMLICRENGLEPRMIGNSNWINCTVPDSILCDVKLHKKIIKMLKPFSKKMNEWQDITTNTVYLVISAKNY